MAADIDEVTNDLLDAADFEEQGSVAKAKAFITHATRYLILHPTSQSDQGTSMAIDPKTVESLLIRAREFVSGRQGAKVRFLSASEGFRR